MKELAKLAEIFNKEFSEPFLRSGKVRANVTDHGTLKVVILGRDIELNKHFEVVGAGCCIEPEEK